MREAADSLKLTAQDLLSLGVIDKIVPEPIGGAQRNKIKTISNVGHLLEQEINAIKEMTPEILRDERRKKFLNVGNKGLA
jgi:acetyl-CoA carboxylase carboxyl transferase subunit alpha